MGTTLSQGAVPHVVVQKVYCPRCQRFVGLLTSDGKGPPLTDCLTNDPQCPMVEALRKYREAKE